MRGFRRWHVTGAIGLGLLGAPLWRCEWMRPAALLPPDLRSTNLPVPDSPSQAALREAAFWRVQAVQRADDECDAEREAVQAWDTAGSFDYPRERQRLLSCDSGGCLQRARQAAQRAAGLARTPKQVQRAAAELVTIDRHR